MTGFGKIGLNAASKVHGDLGCLPPNLEVVAQAVFALRTTTLQYFLLNLLLLISKKTPGKGVAKVRGCALCPYTITACLWDTME